MAGVPFSKLHRAKRHGVFVGRRKKRTTPAEDWLWRYLAALGLSYRFQQAFYTPHYRIVDFYLPDQNIIIEIDGLCHDPEKDRIRDEQLHAGSRS
jgi:very-short-patch-repair endonuclease